MPLAALCDHLFSHGDTEPPIRPKSLKTGHNDGQQRGTVGKPATTPASGAAANQGLPAQRPPVMMSVKRGMMRRNTK